MFWNFPSWGRLSLTEDGKIIEVLMFLIECHILFQTFFLLLFLHNSHGTKEIPDCGILVRPDWVENLRRDNTEPYELFRWVNTEPFVQFRKANTDPSMQFRKDNTDPSKQLRWSHTEFLFCIMLGKNIHESVRPLGHLQTSPGKRSFQDAFGKSLCNALPYCHPSELSFEKLAQNFDSFRNIFNM